MKLFVIILFLACYFLIVAKRKYSLLTVWVGVGILLVFGAILPGQALGSINFNVLGIFAGTMILSGLFAFSNMPGYLAARLVNKTRSVGIAILAVCGLAGFISSFAENVVTVLIVAPIALEVARKLKVSPVGFLIGVAISSNLQGCATMIGDSPSIILAGTTGMNFLDFFWMKGKAGLFFATELGAVGSFLALYWIFRGYKQPVKKLEVPQIKTYVPTILMGLMVLSLIGISFFPRRPYYTVAYICMGFGLLGLIWHQLTHKESLSLVKDLDWRTFLFLVGIFVLVGSLSARGVIQDIAQGISGLSGKNSFLAYTLIVWISVLVSAFVDNIPYTIAMIPVAQKVATSLGVPPQPYLFGLLVGACLGGNITPIAASANVVVVGMLRKEGHLVSFGDFAKIGLPFTLAAVGIAYCFIWIVWGV